MSHPFASVAGLDRIRVGRQSAPALRYTRSYMYSASIIARRIYLQILPYDVGLISRPNLTHKLLEGLDYSFIYAIGCRMPRGSPQMAHTVSSQEVLELVRNQSTAVV